MDLIKIDTNDKGIKTVNARDLHVFLESKKDFSDWIKSRIQKYGFVYDLDFTTIQGKSNGGRPSKEYYVTVDMAKELAMVERTSKGREARMYFIECEKKLINKEFTRMELIEMARSSELKRLASQEINKRLNRRIEQDKPKVEFAETIRHTKQTVTVQEFSKILCQDGLETGQNRLFKTLRGFGILMNDNTPYQRYVDNGWMTLDEFVFIRKDGSEHISKRSLITGKGQTGIWKKLTDGRRPK